MTIAATSSLPATKSVPDARPPRVDSLQRRADAVGDTVANAGASPASAGRGVALAAFDRLARSPPGSVVEVETGGVLQPSSNRASLQPPSSRHSFAEAASDCLGRGGAGAGTMALSPAEAAGANRSASVPNIPATAVVQPPGEVEGCHVAEMLSVPGLPIDQRRASTKSTSQSRPFGSAAAQAVQVVVNAGRRLSAMSGSRRTSDVSSGRSAGPQPVQRELLHCALQRLPMRDFGAEVRATMDVDQFLIQAVLLLDVQETSLEGIVDKMLHKSFRDGHRGPF
ncbi:sodium bicarbonate transporter protein 11 [Tropilaelaps mercedesae]|uniref:Sodium bicarbonate transporter protein 11 n=1 Tax=Tropilaelaps mercedesae TaxID=418985 RepID=A0A1V9XEI7_9ACAR|nr:sodium bicarbonate transporter protein 11 [Tropilaelaps mercedesae]